MGNPYSFFRFSKEDCLVTPPLWTDLVKILTRRDIYLFSLECTNFKKVIFEQILLAHFEDAEIADVKQPQNP